VTRPVVVGRRTSENPPARLLLPGGPEQRHKNGYLVFVSTNGVTIRLALLETPPKLAVSVTVV
jgi:hypothetical protein